ncbi:MAG: endonuclease/exonuclease/phosphatase family protein [Bacteroidota bacterium]
MDQQLAVLLKLPYLAVLAGLVVAAVTGCSSTKPDGGLTTFRVMTVNVHHDDSSDNRVDARRIADVIKEVNPDLVALQGVRRSVVQSETFDVLTTLSDLTGMAYAFGEVRADNERRFGNGFLTRHPILEEQNTLYPLNTSGTQNGLLGLLLDFRGSEIKVMNTHLDESADEADVKFQAGELKSLVLLNAAGPVLVFASSNELSTSEITASLKEILDDAWERVGVGLGFTFPAGHPTERVDFVFFSPGRPGFRAVSARVLNTPSPTHLPLMVEFELVAN